jgi:selenocysteine-specific elongation factor
MPIVGTAGHVDHGKSALVQALTGVDPDRLAEEKRRGMTIELGFGHLVLPDVGEVGIVDVPGHARFLPNMLAGVHGLDAVVLVVAADEGVMPQTREHLDIVDLVGVDRVVVALTKVDLVADGGALAVVEAEVSGELARRGLSAEIVRVAAPRGEGVDEVRDAIARVLGRSVHRVETGVVDGPRLPVDRVFVLAGFGPVVTGSLVGGGLRVGDEVELVPSGRGGGDRPRRARIRGLQQHGRPVEAAAPGGRVAINLQGVDRDQLRRGQVLAPPGSLDTTSRVLLPLRVLAGTDRPLAHNSRVTAFSGTASAGGRVRLIEGGRTEVAPGATGRVELRLDVPMALRDGDAIVLRRASPAGTVAGGRVAAIAPPRFVRRHGHWQEVARPGADPEAVVVAAVRAYLERHPVRAGMPRAEVRPEDGTGPRAVALAIDAALGRGALVARGRLLAPAGWQPRLTPAQVAAVERVLTRLAATPMAPPRAAELASEGLNETVRRYLEEQQLVVRVAPDLVMLPGAVSEAEARLRAHIVAHGGATVAEARDVLASSRRTVVPLLEYFDAVRLTRRQGDVRVLAG